MPEGFREKAARLERGEPGIYVEDRGPEGVFLVELPIVGTDKDGKRLPAPDKFESRLDSREDASRIAAGSEPWWMKYADKSSKTK
jgi:hypothetical protein